MKTEKPSAKAGAEMGKSHSASTTAPIRPIILGSMSSEWLDGKAGTTPWLMILFICFGFAAGLRAVMVAMRKSDRAAERNEAVAAARAAAATPRSAP